MDDGRHEWSDLRLRILAHLERMDPWDTQAEQTVTALKDVMALHEPWPEPSERAFAKRNGCRACMWRRRKRDCPTVVAIGKALGIT